MVTVMRSTAHENGWASIRQPDRAGGHRGYNQKPISQIPVGSFQRARRVDLPKGKGARMRLRRT